MADLSVKIKQDEKSYPIIIKMKKLQIYQKSLYHL